MPGGTLDLGESEYIVRTLGEFESLEEIENHVIASDPSGRQIRIRDVGRRQGHAGRPADATRG